MTELGLSCRRRDRGYRLMTRVVAVVLPVAWLRFPAEDLAGLTPATRAAFTAARSVALWRDGQLIGLTSGHRSAEAQACSPVQ